MEQEQPTDSCIHVWGAGAVGCAITADLDHKGLKPTLWSLRGQGSYHLMSGPSGHDEEIWAREVPGDLILSKGRQLHFICGKVYQVATYLKHLQRSIAKQQSSTVIICANGYRPLLHQQWRGLATNLLLRRGLCYFGVSEIQPRTFQLRSAQVKMVWGPVFDQQVQSVHERFWIERLGEQYTWKDSLHEDLRHKWLCNALINGLSAAYALETNGKLINYRQQVSDLLPELWQWADQRWGRGTQSQSAFEKDLWDLVEVTKENQNSTIRDLKQGRKSELAFLLQPDGDGGNTAALDQLRHQILRRWQLDDDFLFTKG